MGLCSNSQPMVMTAEKLCWEVACKRPRLPYALQSPSFVHYMINTGVNDGMSMCQCFAGVYLLSPLLHSLTRSISEDSIIAMAVGLLILHLYLHDYK